MNCKVYNCFPSFTSTFVSNYNNATVANPVPNYGSFGDHIKDYFDKHMSETVVGGTDYLVAFLASSKDLTSIVASDLTGMNLTVQAQYNLTPQTEGYALLDFRGESWKYIIGDGIAGPSNTGLTAYTETKTSAVEILNYFKGNFPLVKWSFAGLPHLPWYTTFAPKDGQAWEWLPSQTNTPGSANNWWDADHPIGASHGNDSAQFFMWKNTPQPLKRFYASESITRVRDILDVSDWACPDTTPPMSDAFDFGKYLSSTVNVNDHTLHLVEQTKEYAKNTRRKFVVMPLVSNMHSSRESDYLDSYGSFLTQRRQVVQERIIEDVPSRNRESSEVRKRTVQPTLRASVYTDFAVEEDGNSREHDALIPHKYLAAGMMEPAIRAGADGIIYQDLIPLMVAQATRTYQYSTSQPDQNRSRNFLAREVYKTNDPTVIPWAGVENELLAHLSYEVVPGILKRIPETIPVGDKNWKTEYLRNPPTNPSSSSPSAEVDGYKSIAWIKPPQPTNISTLLGDPTQGGGGGANCCGPEKGTCCLGKVPHPYAPGYGQGIADDWPYAALCLNTNHPENDPCLAPNNYDPNNPRRCCLDNVTLDECKSIAADLGHNAPNPVFYSYQEFPDYRCDRLPLSGLSYCGVRDWCKREGPLDSTSCSPWPWGCRCGDQFSPPFPDGWCPPTHPSPQDFIQLCNAPPWDTTACGNYSEVRNCLVPDICTPPPCTDLSIPECCQQQGEIECCADPTNTACCETFPSSPACPCDVSCCQTDEDRCCESGPTPNCCQYWPGHAGCGPDCPPPGQNCRVVVTTECYEDDGCPGGVRYCNSYNVVCIDDSCPCDITCPTEPAGGDCWEEFTPCAEDTCPGRCSPIGGFSISSGACAGICNCPPGQTRMKFGFSACGTGKDRTPCGSVGCGGGQNQPCGGSFALSGWPDTSVPKSVTELLANPLIDYEYKMILLDQVGEYLGNVTIPYITEKSKQEYIKDSEARRNETVEVRTKGAVADAMKSYSNEMLSEKMILANFNANYIASEVTAAKIKRESSFNRLLHAISYR